MWMCGLWTLAKMCCPERQWRVREVKKRKPNSSSSSSFRTWMQRENAQPRPQFRRGVAGPSGGLMFVKPLLSRERRFQSRNQVNQEARKPSHWIQQAPSLHLISLCIYGCWLCCTVNVYLTFLAAFWPSSSSTYSEIILCCATFCVQHVMPLHPGWADWSDKFVPLTY